MSLRLDIGGLRPSHRTDEGYLICDAIVSRVGVFPYRNPDGSTRYEARHREDVCDPASLESLAGKPVVLLHPRKDGKSVSVGPENVQEFQVGTLGTELVEIGNGQIRAQLIVHRKDAIDAIEGRGQFKVRGVSPGYAVKEDHTPGKLRGVRYDLAQRNIRYNHVAIVPVGRQGIHLRADEGTAISTRFDADEVEPYPSPTQTPPESAMSTAKLKIDGAEYEVPTALVPVIQAREQRIDALETAVEAHDAATAAATEKLDAETKRADTAEGKAAALEAAAADRTDAPDEASMIAWANARAELRGVAAALKVDVADDATNDAIKRAIVKSRIDSMPDDASVDRIDGSYEAIAASVPAKTRNDALAAAAERSDSKDAKRPVDSQTRREDAQKTADDKLKNASKRTA